MAADPAQSPYDVIPLPGHVGNLTWRENTYDASSGAPLGLYTKSSESGHLDPNTGRKAGEFDSSDVYQQV